MPSIYPKNFEPDYKGNRSPRTVADFQAARARMGFAANENRRAIKRLTTPLKFALRLHPLIRIGLTAWDIYRELNQHNIVPERAMNFHGWQLHRDCGGGDDILMASFAFSGCGVQETFTATNYNSKVNKISVSGSYYYAHTWRDLVTVGSFKKVYPVRERSILISDYVSGSLLTPRPAHAPFQMPITAPVSWTVSPSLMPVHEFLPNPAPVPYKAIPKLRPNPNLNPAYQRRTGGDVQKGLRPDQVPFQHPPQGVGAEGELPSSHTLGRPPAGTKETKVVVKGLGPMYQLISDVTEAVDLLNVLYDALPDQYKPKYKGTDYVRTKVLPHEKLQILYRNWRHLDVPKAIEGFILEQIEDYVYGRSGRALKRASQQRRPHHELPIGFQVGPAI